MLSNLFYCKYYHRLTKLFLVMSHFSHNFHYLGKKGFNSNGQIVLLFTCHSLQPPSTSGPTALQLYWALSKPSHWYRKCKDAKRRTTVLDGSNDWLLWSNSKSPLGCVCSSAAPSLVPRLPPCPETIPAIKGEKGFQSDQDNQSVFVLSKIDNANESMFLAK